MCGVLPGGQEEEVGALGRGNRVCKVVDTGNPKPLFPHLFCSLVSHLSKDKRAEGRGDV
jgi:hypothetical protein